MRAPLGESPLPDTGRLERDLVEAHPEYETYRRNVPMLVPFTKRRAQTTQRTVSAVQPR